MKILRFLSVLGVTFVVGCWNGKGTYLPPDPAPAVETLVRVTWESLTQFMMAEVTRIDVTTEQGTECCDAIGSYVRIPYEFTQVISVRLYIPYNRGSIIFKPDEFTYSDNEIAITLDLSDYTFVPDRATLESIRYGLKGFYLQTADIDLSESAWTPITPDWSTSFKGVYDGRDFAISNMNVETTDSNLAVVAGLFGSNAGTIRNIRFEDCHISSTNSSSVYCGGACGINTGIVTGCSFAGTLTAKSPDVYIGGLCGLNSGILAMCSNSAVIDAESTKYCRIGGVCGQNSKNIVSCYNSGSLSVSGNEVYFGGVSGINQTNAILTACYHSGSLSVKSSTLLYVGCVSGVNYVSSSITSYCYWVESELISSGFGLENGSSVGMMAFGNDASCWPDSSLPGWGSVKPDCWDESKYGVWSDPWESLGSWSSAPPTYPTLRRD